MDPAAAGLGPPRHQKGRVVGEEGRDALRVAGVEGVVDLLHELHRGAGGGREVVTGVSFVGRIAATMQARKRTVKGEGFRTVMVMNDRPDRPLKTARLVSTAITDCGRASRASPPVAEVEAGRKAAPDRDPLDHTLPPGALRLAHGQLVAQPPLDERA